MQNLERQLGLNSFLVSHQSRKVVNTYFSRVFIEYLFFLYLLRIKRSLYIMYCDML